MNPPTPNRSTPNAALPPASSETDRLLGENPDEQQPIHGLMTAVEVLLRQPRRLVYQLQHGDTGDALFKFVIVAVVLTAVYGAIVGSFSGGPQWGFAPIKIVGGTLAAAAICLPSLFLFACLSGSPVRFWPLCGALAGMLALTALLLVGFAPVAWLFAQSTESIFVMGALHLLFWSVATRFGVRFLLTTLRHFGLRTEAGVKLWVLIFCLVSLQMTATLRPLLGPAETVLPAGKKFFFVHWLDCIGEPRR